MSAYIYLEGGASGDNSKELSIRCQQAFHTLVDRMGFQGRKPRLVACGGRASVHDRFRTAHKANAGGYIAMWIHSEEPMADLEKAWKHLAEVTTVEAWEKPGGAEDEQVLFMTTCMETWLAADRLVLKEHFGTELQESALPPLNDLEKRARHDVQDSLTHATRYCTNAYAKGKSSFQVFSKLTPAILEQHLPSFVRVRRILNAKL